MEITVGVQQFKGIRLTIGYTMTNAATGETVLTGKTTHCFTDRTGKPVILKKQFPEFDAKLKGLVQERAD